jgi:hypothetical protein
MRSLAVFSILCSVALASQVIAAAPNGGGSGGAAAASSGSSVAHGGTAAASSGGSVAHGGTATASGAASAHGRSAGASSSGSTHDTAPAVRAQQLQQLPSPVRYAAMRAVTQPSPKNLARLKKKLHDYDYQQQVPDSHVFCPSAEEKRARVGDGCIDISRLEGPWATSAPTRETRDAHRSQSDIGGER